MSASAPSTSCWILALCLTALLFAQITGLHYHHHVELGGDGSNSLALHVEDAGIHSSDGAVMHAPALVDDDQLHIDMDSALKSVLVKWLLGALLLILPPTALLLVLPLKRSRLPRPEPDRRRGCPSRSRLRPPSQAPPVLLVPV